MNLKEEITLYKLHKAFGIDIDKDIYTKAEAYLNEQANVISRISDKKDNPILAKVNSSNIIKDSSVEIVFPDNAIQEETTLDLYYKNINLNKKQESNNKISKINKNDRTTSELEYKLNRLEKIVSRISAIGPGSGEVNFRFLDDVDISTIEHGKVLSYNGLSNKFEFIELGAGENRIITYFKIMTGNEEIIHDHEHGMDNILSVTVMDLNGSIIYVYVSIDEFNMVTVSSIKDLTGYKIKITGTLEDI